MRLSLLNRLENLALDFLQDLVEARYTRDRTATLRRMNLRLEQLRVLLRLCHDRRLLTPEGYEYGARMLLEAGRMVGGWIRSREPGAALGVSAAVSGEPPASDGYAAAPRPESRPAPRPLPAAPGGP
jgi:hypothetical protein